MCHGHCIQIVFEDLQLNAAYHEPDFWMVIALKKSAQDRVIRVLASWRQTYLTGEEWRASSPIRCMERKGGRVIISVESGSTYNCPYANYGTTGYAQEALEDLIDEGRREGVLIEPLQLHEVEAIKWA